MSEQKLYDILAKESKTFGVEITKEMFEKFYIYKRLLQEWNEKMNLTAITDDESIMVKHFADSVSIVPFVREIGAKNAADIGTGAGFPGIPLKICCPELDLCLCDSLAKRLTFLNEVCRQTELKNVDIVHSRAEDLGRNPKYREKFDFVTARAVAAMPVLLEYCMPFVKVGGYFAAMKGNPENEPDFNNALKLLNGKVEKEDDFLLSAGDEKQHRHIFYVKKVRQISTIYPRKAGIATKKPL
ncbi:MAG: 16S rRNA (guanine(527)-N(7))-methyltransferase RsmG [Clostridia bacterium]|nr:16S rRNA (guanine(527)-N(7))-methyltransferase RsmG [Clostridia bacterium]